MSKKKSISVQEKISIVKAYIDKEIGICEAARRGKVSRDTMVSWVRNYEREGIEAFLGRKNKAYSTELKNNAVKAYLSGEGGLTNICKKYGIRDKKQLRNWIKVYNSGGDLGSVKHSGGGSYMKQGRETTQAERIEIAKACIALGKNYGEIALKYQVSYQQVRSWTLKFEKEGASGLEDRRGKRKKDQEPRNELEEAKIEIEQLKHQLYLSEMENYLLKKVKEIERRDASTK